MRAGRRKALARLLATVAAAASLPALAASGGESAAATAGTAARPTVLVVGDSVSAEYGLRRGTGWVELLAQRLAQERPPLQVVNASVSGETTAGGRSRIDALLQRHRPVVVVLELGGNDALRGLDLRVTEANLDAMAAAATKAGARVLLLGMQVPPNYGRAYTDAFSALFGRVARRADAELVPFFLEAIAARPEMFQPDRIHPNEAAQQLLFETAWPAMQRTLRAARR